MGYLYKPRSILQMTTMSQQTLTNTYSYKLPQISTYLYSHQSILIHMTGQIVVLIIHVHKGAIDLGHRLEHILQTLA